MTILLLALHSVAIVLWTVLIMRGLPRYGYILGVFFMLNAFIGIYYNLGLCSNN